MRVFPFAFALSANAASLALRPNSVEHRLPEWPHTYYESIKDTNTAKISDRFKTRLSPVFSYITIQGPHVVRRTSFGRAVNVKANNNNREAHSVARTACSTGLIFCTLKLEMRQLGTCVIILPHTHSAVLRVAIDILRAQAARNVINTCEVEILRAFSFSISLLYTVSLCVCVCACLSVRMCDDDQLRVECRLHAVCMNIHQKAIYNIPRITIIIGYIHGLKARRQTH